jgi:hypothetical protein
MVYGLNQTCGLRRRGGEGGGGGRGEIGEGKSDEAHKA